MSFPRACSSLSEQVNKERIEKSLESMKKLKYTMQNRLFQMKEAFKKEDSYLNMRMLEKENSTGPLGPQGPPGHLGALESRALEEALESRAI